MSKIAVRPGNQPIKAGECVFYLNERGGRLEPDTYLQRGLGGWFGKVLGYTVEVSDNDYRRESIQAALEDELQSNGYIVVDAMLDERMRDPEFARLFRVEGAVNDMGEQIANIMQAHGVSTLDLAGRLNMSEAQTQRILAGEWDSLRVYAEVMDALGYNVRVLVEKRYG